MKNSIKIGPNFFSGEMRNYSNWRTAFARELLQNSNDAGASKIDITISKKDNGNVIYKIEDNGSGMEKNVLLNTFLVMGETTKKDSKTVGGFGKAKIIIAFSQVNYKIKSFEYACTGCGAEYEIKKSNSEMFRGCIFEIEIEASDSDWVEITKSVLKKCTLYPSVYINGEKFTDRIRQSKLIRSLSYADVYVNKSAEPGVMIRSGGVWMFSKYSDIKAQVCVELHNTARQSLTANRDGLQYKEDNELQAFLNELASDTKSSLRDRTKHFKKFVNKEKCFKSKPRSDFKIGESGGLIKNDSTNTLTKQVFSSGGFEESIGNINKGSINPIEEESLPVYEVDPILASMMVFSETDSPKMIQLIKNFYMPEKWTGQRTATRYQLIRIWFALCRIAMDELSNLTKNEFGFAVGWVFSDSADDESTEAAHYYSEGVHYLLLNPITINDLKLKYSVNSVDDYFSLAILAVHESVHCIEAASQHNETFSSMFTELLKRVMNRRKEFVNDAKEAKDN